MLSHELRTPLTPVVLALETLQKQWPQNEEARSTLEMIRRNIAVESHLIDDLLDLTRISKGKLELSLATLDAHVQVCNVVEMCRAEAEAKKIRLQVNLACDRSSYRRRRSQVSTDYLEPAQERFQV